MEKTNLSAVIDEKDFGKVLAEFNLYKHFYHGELDFKDWLGQVIVNNCKGE